MLCIVGTGGFGREVLCCFIDSLNGNTENLSEKVCFMVDDLDHSINELKGISVLKISELDIHKHEVVVAVGKPETRANIVNRLPENVKFATLIHPSAIISKWVNIGEGSIICAGCIITTDVKIGKHAQINLNTTIGHDCVIGDYFTTAPSVNISGNCTIDNRVYLGSGSGIKQQVSICADVTIGMGGIVINSIAHSGTYVGNPVRKLNK